MQRAEGIRIGIIGGGNVGSAAAKRFVDAGHEVAIANSRGPETLQSLVTGLGPLAHAATSKDAADFGDVVLVAIPFGRYRELPADRLAGKIVVDANNYYPRRDGHVPELDSDQTTSSELLARSVPGAKVVKAFNTMQSGRLASEGRPGMPREERMVLFVAGDDPEAKREVSRLIEETGFTPVDTGSLAEGGRRQQPGSPVYTALLTEAEARSALQRA
jgi:predicted dinucleotide-binding enzyme